MILDFLSRVLLYLNLFAKDSFEQEYHHNMITFSFYRTLFIFKLRKDAQMCHNMSLHFPDSMARIIA